MNVKNVDIKLLKPNVNQPRKFFDNEKLTELAISIKQYGVLQPIIVSELEDGTYRIIAGERRYRASLKAEVKEVPIIVSEVNRYTADMISIIENVQRDDLSAIEEALAYTNLIEKYELSQTEVGKLIGKRPSTISNKIRLLKLPTPVRDAISANKISERHGRALLNLDEDVQIKYLNKTINEDLTVKDLEKEIEKKSNKKTSVKKQKAIVSKDFRIAINTIMQAVTMIENTGLNVEVSEDIDGDDLNINLKISRR